MLDAIEPAVAPFPKAAMFELSEDGWTTPFQQLVACLISVRTLDEPTLPIARRLFESAPTPDAMLALGELGIYEIIRPATFSERKAKQILAIAERTIHEFGGALPCDEAVMRSFAGIGVKCTNLTLGIACGQPRVSVDVHVHRVTNRWGLIATSTPEQSTVVLEQILPDDQKVRINRLLVPFGKHICTGTLPHCSTCPVRESCQRVGVARHR
jgi:endonuclease-3